MSYTEEELDAMMQEELMNSGEEIFFINPTNMKKASLADLKFSDNEEVFNTLKNQISNREYLNLEYGIEDGSPYYTNYTSLSNGKRLYLNEEIIIYIYNWLEKGVTDSPIPNTFHGEMNADENYVLRLIKRDRKNGWNYYNPDNGYKGKSENGVVFYGKLPYSPNELVDKLASIPDYDF